MPRATKFGKMVTYSERLSPLNHMTLWSRGLVRSCDKLNHYISTTTILMATKFDKKVT